MTFQDLFSHPELLQAIEDVGYTTPTQIQQEAIPEVIKGSDLQACAQTGTGKSAAFLLPALLKVLTPTENKGKGPRILILVPTRELAMQVAAEAVKYSKRLSMVKTVCIFGGQPFPIQNKELSRHYDILVATPGRLIDHMERGRIEFSRLEMMILDEADRMLDMGFIDDVEHIAEATPENRQTLMFSATLKPSVLKLSKRLLKNPIEIRITPQVEEHRQIEQKLHFVDNITHKYTLLEDLLIDESINQAIIFTATKRHADELCDKLCEMGHRADVLHGDLKQAQRTRTISKMRQGKIRILVATDVAARGIDVPTITHVINFDLPNNAEDYVHRIGRTGRAGATGLAISFVSPKDRSMVREIERFTGKKLLPEGEEGRDFGRGGKSDRRGGSRGNSGRGSSRGSSRFERPRQERRSNSEGFREERSQGFRAPREDRAPREERAPRAEGRNSNDERPSREPRESFKERAPRKERFDSDEQSERAPREGFRERKAQKEGRFGGGEQSSREPREGFSPGKSRSQSRFSEERSEGFKPRHDSRGGFKPRGDFGDRKPAFENRRAFGQSNRPQGNKFGPRPEGRFGQKDKRSAFGKTFDKPFSEKRGFSKDKESGSGYFERREKKSSDGFIKTREGDFQGSNAHREKAKAFGKNSTFKRKRSPAVYNPNAKRKEASVATTEE